MYINRSNYISVVNFSISRACESNGVKREDIFEILNIDTSKTDLNVIELWKLATYLDCRIADLFA